MTELRIAYDEVQHTLRAILERHTMTPPRAALCAQLFADASRDGIPTHGLNRFERFINCIREGSVLPNAEPTLIASAGALERWDAHTGPGPLNAHHAMSRAIELTKTHGIGCVALTHSNHWMRAGNFGWLAADNACIGICWTNTLPLMAPWGGKERKLGNNPLVLAIPRANGEHIVLDMAMSLYSWGKLGVWRREGQQAPMTAGLDHAGQPTTDPDSILTTGTAMPIGFWKGAGLALLLDLIAASLAGGMAAWQIPAQKNEQNVSQIFIAIDPAKVGVDPEPILHAALADYHDSEPIDPAHPILHPGQHVLLDRRKNLAQGIPVDPEIWQRILTL